MPGREECSHLQWGGIIAVQPPMCYGRGGGGGQWTDDVGTGHLHLSFGVRIDVSAAAMVWLGLPPRGGVTCIHIRVDGQNISLWRKKKSDWSVDTVTTQSGPCPDSIHKVWRGVPPCCFGWRTTNADPHYTCGIHPHWWESYGLWLMFNWSGQMVSTDSPRSVKRMNTQRIRDEDRWAGNPRLGSNWVSKNRLFDPKCELAFWPFPTCSFGFIFVPLKAKKNKLPAGRIGSIETFCFCHRIMGRWRR